MHLRIEPGLLKARKAFEKFGKFDLVVINIDSTDIGDEWLRYRVPLVRDRDGRIVRIPFKNDKEAQFMWNGKLWAEDSSLYIIRLIKFAYFYKVLVPSFYEFTDSASQYQDLMKYLFKSKRSVIEKNRYAYFQKQIFEMIEEIEKYTNGPESIFITHHPHRNSLEYFVEVRPRYTPVISETLEVVDDRKKVNVLDARDHITKIHKNKLKVDTFVKNDPYSHLDKNGAVRYGKWIAKNILENLKSGLGSL